MRARYTKCMIGLLCLMFALPALAQKAPKAQGPNTETHLFQVVILIGDKEANGAPTDIPANAMKAVDDIREFLPYKSYRMVDTALIRSAGEGRGLMSGPDGRDFNVDLRYFKTDGKIFLRQFRLVDTSRQPNRSLLDTSFEVGLGETIVVGSSKLDGGNQALIVLFTAIQ